MIKDKVEIEAKDIKRLLLKVYKRYQSGAISESQANKETYILNSIIRAIETTDLEDRLKNIERSLQRAD